MDGILMEIKEAFRLRLYYLSLMLSFSLPDICAALESKNGQTSEDKYRAWVEKWLSPKFGDYLTPQDMYRLRCGVLHQGRMGHPRLPYGRIAFSVNYLAHKTVVPSRKRPEVLVMHISLFCKDVVESVAAWQETHKDDPIVQRNLSRLVQYRSNGLLPYLEGVACVS